MKHKIVTVHVALSLVLALLLALPSSVSAASPLSNPGFETGDLSGWSVSIPPGGYALATSAYGVYGPVGGSYFALMKTDGPGSYTSLSQTLVVNAGDKVSGHAFFDTGDYAPFNDNAMVRILDSGNNLVATLFYADVYQVGNFGATPWTYFEHTFSSAGSFTLEARVANALDSAFDSHMGLDGLDLNSPPDADAGGPYLIAVNESIMLDGSASDPEGDALTLQWTAEAGSFDDATLEDPTYTAPSDAGIYELTLTATDPGGLSDTSVTSVVVYDPSAGFVTGGGWIDSPAGAYKPDPSLSGKANFGFVSKYKKGANAPTGQTEFQFKAGDLNFHSSSYEWLVVNQGGQNAQFKGDGTINGMGDYKFMLWAGDGSGTDGADTFRIRIWTEDGAGAETDVYDNGTDQDIGGGSVVIHTK